MLYRALTIQVLFDDFALTDEDTTVAVAVLRNDVDDGAIRVTGITGGPRHGAASFNATHVIYTPESDWFGVDSLEYAATDEFNENRGGRLHGTATVTVTVRPVNDVPRPNLKIDLKINCVYFFLGTPRQRRAAAGDGRRARVRRLASRGVADAERRRRRGRSRAAGVRRRPAHRLGAGSERSIERPIERSVERSIECSVQRRPLGRPDSFVYVPRPPSSAAADELRIEYTARGFGDAEAVAVGTVRVSVFAVPAAGVARSCLSGCSSHGACDSSLGQCSCSRGWFTP